MMDIWRIKYLSMWNARFLAANAIFVLVLLVRCLASGDYLFAVINGASLVGSVWMGIKAYRLAVARI